MKTFERLIRLNVVVELFDDVHLLPSVYTYPNLWSFQDQETRNVSRRKKERRWVSFIYIIFFSGDGIWSLRESKTRIKSREIYKFTKLSMKVRGETGHETSGDQHDDWNDL